jgi:hypothetical protein
MTFGMVELLTLTPRNPEPAFELDEWGLSVSTRDPLPVGTLVLAVLGLPGERRAHDVIIRVVWIEGQVMGLEFLLPDDALREAIAKLVHSRARQGRASLRGATEPQ